MKNALFGFILFESMAIAPAFAAVDTVWDFNGNLAATAGASTIAYRGDTALHTTFGTTASLGLPSMYGDTGGTASIMAFPATTASEGYTITTNAAASVAQYSMIWDVYYPSSSDMNYRALYQTNGSNGNDADLFVNQRPWGGVGISGIYHGAIVPGTWNRVAITRNASGAVTKYVNGGYVGQQPLSDSRWTLDPTYSIFTDDDNETRPGYVSSYRFVDRTMTQQEIFNLGGVNARGANVAGQTFSNASSFTPGSYTIAVLGDSQSYVANSSYTSIFNSMTQWLVNNKTSRNIQFVMHEGDVVDNNGTASQWTNAMSAMNTLNGQIPYAVVPGNHDYSDSRSVSSFNQSSCFGPGSTYAAQTTLAGYYPAEPNSRMNTYHTFTVGSQEYLVLALEFGPRNAVVDWAKGVVDAHPNARTILLTHGYMYDGGALFNGAVDPSDPQGRTCDEIRDVLVGHEESGYNPQSYSWIGADGNDGKELWDKIVKDSNVPLVCSGHQFDELDGFPYLKTNADDGDPVYQMLFDTQARQAGGEGWIRLLEFQPDGKTIQVKTYSPYYNQWSYASDEYYTIMIPEPSSLIAMSWLLASVVMIHAIRKKRNRAS